MSSFWLCVHAGVSSGAIVGIVLGVVAIVALIAVLIAVVYMHRENKKKPAEGGAIDVGAGQVQYDASGDSVSANVCSSLSWKGCMGILCMLVT